MLKYKNYFIIGAMTIIVVILSAFLGIFLAGGFKKDKTIANGIVINKKDQEYEAKLITSAKDYNDLITKYDAQDTLLFTSNDFTDKDYIVDFILYQEDLIINNIDVTVSEDGISLTYYANKEISDSDKYLMYFIPIEKGSIDNITIKSRRFQLK